MYVGCLEGPGRCVGYCSGRPRLPRQSLVLWVKKRQNSVLRVVSCAETGAGDHTPWGFHSPREACPLGVISSLLGAGLRRRPQWAPPAQVPDGGACG